MNDQTLDHGLTVHQIPRFHARVAPVAEPCHDTTPPETRITDVRNVPLDRLAAFNASL